MPKLLNAVRVNCPTTGTGATLAIGSAVSTAYQTPAAAGAVAGDVYTITIDDGAQREITVGTIGAGATSIDRAATPIWSSTGARLNLSGSAIISFGPAADDLPAGKVSVDVRTSGTSYTVPPGAQAIEVILYAGGGGGGSGARQATTSGRAGGGGGAGGGSARTVLSGALPATIAYTVGAGGVGGASVATDSTAGASGSPGGTSSVTVGGRAFYAWGGGGGGGGTTSAGTAGNQGNGGFNMFPGQAGGAGATTTGANGNAAQALIGGGGGGGGAAASSTTAASGGRGGGIDAVFPTGTAGANGTDGVSRDNASGVIPAAMAYGCGASGGNYATGMATGAGGNGGRYGAGGGGGAASDNGFASGKGGDGGSGAVVFIAYF